MAKRSQLPLRNPLKSLARQWRSLRRKNRISLTLITLALSVPLLLSALYFLKPQVASASWFDHSFKYRKSYTITKGGNNLTDYQYNIVLDTDALIAAGKMQSDCDDIRVTGVNGQALPFWVEESGPFSCDTTATNIWVKLPMWESSGITLYVYYGNPNALDAGNGSATFEFFDDFNSGTLNTTVWAGDTGDFSITNGILSVTSQNKGIYSANYSYTDGVAATSVRGTSGTTTANIGRQSGGAGTTRVTDAGYFAQASISNDRERVFTADNSTATQQTNRAETLGHGTWHALELRTLGTTITADANSSGNTSITDATYSSGNVALHTDQTNKVEWDFVFVRKRVSTGTIAATTGSEETTPGAIAEWLFDEGQGQTIQDTTNNNNDGTLGADSSASTDDPARKTEDQCISGKCLLFDGTTDYISGPNIDLADESFSIGLWFKTTETGTNQVILGQGSEASNNGLLIAIRSTNYLTFSFWGNDLNETSTPIVPNTWYHIEATYNTTTNDRRFYINGQLVGVNAPATDFQGTGNIYLGGGDGPWSGNYYGGFLDEVKIYPYARSATEVAADFNAGSAVLGTSDQAALSEGLLGYWKMDESSWNGTSSEVLDASGNGSHGTRAGDATTTTLGKFGRAGTFDGTGDYVTLTNTTNLQRPSTAITLSTWFKISDSTAAQRLISYGTINRGYEVVMLSTGLLQFYLGSGSTATAVYSTSAYEDDTWHHFAATWDQTSGQMKMFIDGTQVNSGTFTATIGGYTGTPRIAETSSGGSSPFSGQLDETRVYNRALSPDEVKALYNFAPGPFAHYSFDQTETSTLIDYSGNNNTGSLANVTSANLVTGKYGTALDFNGSNTAADLYDSGTSFASQFNGNKGSVMFWMKVDSGTWSDGSFRNAIHIVPNNDDRMQIAKNTTSNQLLFAFKSGGTQSLYSTTSLSSTDWVHVAMTWDEQADSVVGYVNGTQVVSDDTLGTWTADLINHWTNIGAARSDFPGQVWDGALDEVKFYNYARTPEQIQYDMQGTSLVSVAGGGGEKLPTPLAHYAFDEQQGQTVNNKGLSGSSLNGTLGANSSASTDDPTWKTKADCKINGCLSFDGSADYVDKGTAFNSVQAVSFWVYPTTTTEYPIDINGTAYVWINSGTVTAQGFTSPTIYVNGRASSTVAAGQWSHVVVTTQTALNASDFDIGRIEGVGYHEGRLDEVKLYNVALTASQVTQELNAGLSLNFGATAAQESSLLSDGAGNPPVLHWNFDEKTGSSANDVSGNGNVGAFTGSVTHTRGKSGSAVRFTTSDSDKIEDATPTNIPDNDDAKTVSYWYRVDAHPPSSSDTAISLLGLSSSALYCGINSSEVWCWKYGGTELVSGTLPDVGEWVHVTYTFDGTTHRLYVNGIFQESSTVTPDTGAVAFVQVGHNGTATVQDWEGDIDEVKIYDYARTQAQVTYDYNRGAPVAHWKLDECEGTTVNDASGNGNSGSITIGGSGTQTSVGTCSTSGTAWGNGASGKYSSSINLDGNDDYVDMGDIAVSDVGSNDFTISTWAYRSSGFGPYNYMVAGKWNNGSSPGTNEWILQMGNGTSPTNTQPSLSVEIASTIYKATSSVITSDETWYHLVGLRRGTSIYIYVNAELVGSTSVGSGAVNNISGRTFKVGAIDSGYNMTGKIDDVRIYNYALSADQIKQLYNGGFATFYTN